MPDSQSINGEVGTKKIGLSASQDLFNECMTAVSRLVGRSVMGHVGQPQRHALLQYEGGQVGQVGGCDILLFPPLGLWLVRERTGRILHPNQSII